MISNSKKILLVIPFLFFLSIHSVSAEDASFPDVSFRYPYEEAVSDMKEDAVIQGYPDGTYKPDQTMNRAEFIKVVVASLDQNPQGSDCFTDVKTDWYAKYVCAAKKRGIIRGYPDGSFKPGQNINVVEASKVVTKAFSLNMGASSNVWYEPYIRALESKKAIPVSINYANRKVTRGEMAEMVWRVKENIETKPTKTYSSLTSEFPAIASCEELEEKFAMQSYVMQSKGGMGRGFGGGIGFENSLGIALPSVAPQAAEGEGEGAASFASSAASASPDFSSTNVQVEGVDEADIVKNDGEYIYLLKGTTVRIVKAFPPSELREFPKIELTNLNEKNTAENFSPAEMYVDGNDLVVIGNSYVEKTLTVVMVFDITDRSSVSLKREVDFDGSYLSSRKIQDRVYVVTNDYPLYRIIPLFQGENQEIKLEADDLIPNFYDSRTNRETPAVPCSKVNFYPQYQDTNFLVVASVPLSGADTQAVRREVFMGGGQTIYASLENLYVAATKYDYDEQVKYDIWIPPVTSVKTVIYRYALDPANIEYKGSGEVPGTVKNQFSMDEHGQYFRIATTSGEFQSTENNVYVLNRDSLEEVVGKLEKIAEGETIHSVRYIGDRAYMVTFRRVDPFFVIDLSVPSSPQILGYLKIPGYSDYLHPYDDNHIIGFGQNLPEDWSVVPENFQYGMKIALFDVSDVAHPALQFETIIPGRGTDSELLFNHKALFFDKARNLLGFPVNVRDDSYLDIFRGAYIYSLDLQNGFQLKAEISHFPENFQFHYDDLNYYYTMLEQEIRRIVRIGESLYTVSPGTIKAFSTSDLSVQGQTTLEPLPQDQGGVIYFQYF